MKCKIWLDNDGCEAWAKGISPDVWMFAIRVETSSFYNEEHEGLLLATIDLPMPSREACLDPALTMLEEKRKQLLAATAAAEMELQRRKESLLAIGYEHEKSSQERPEDWRDSYECIITGCYLVQGPTTTTYYGDLWRCRAEPHQFLLNPVCGPDGKPAEQSGRPSEEAKILYVESMSIKGRTILSDNAWLNATARNYIEDAS